jgi:hypothetical protein
VCSSVQAPENHSPQHQKSSLAIAVAKGTAVASWAKDNRVPRRTAFRWAKDRKVRAKIETCRRRALDRAIGHLSHKVNWAAHGITTLAATAASESVRLSAYRTVFSNMMAASEFAELKDRITELEELLDERERAVGTGQAG